MQRERGSIKCDIDLKCTDVTAEDQSAPFWWGGVVLRLNLFKIQDEGVRDRKTLGELFLAAHIS